MRRKEDSRLLLGRACFTDDVHLDRMVHGVFVRSQIAHARILGINPSVALAAGALLVLTAEDLPFIDRDFVLRYANPHIRGGLPDFLARDRVRFVGEPVAFLVAADQYAAEDLAALVEVDYELLPAVGSTAAAIAPDAPSLHVSWPSNVAATFTRSLGEPQAAMAAAPHRLKRRFEFGRQVPLPLETRGCVADFNCTELTLTIWSSTQTHYSLRQNISALLDLPESSVRVVAANVGGGFGSKSRPYVEDIVVSHASRMLGRPVKWIEDRFEHLQATTHSRAIDTELEVGFDGAGRILALSANMVADIGAYVFTSGLITSEVAASVLAGPYKVSNLYACVTCIGTNKTPLATFRGAGQPEASLPVECMMDLIARALGIDAIEVRRRNLVAPADLPFPAWIPIGDAVGEIESGDYPQMLERLAQNSGYSELLTHTPAGETLAWGLACGFELTGFINFESAKVRIGLDGKVTVWSGMTSQGQGQFTTYAHVCAEALGVDIADVTVHMGDTDMLPFGRGAFGSRGAVVGANAVVGAARLLSEKLLIHAAVMLCASPGELTVDDGRVLRGGVDTGLNIGGIANAVAPGGPYFKGESSLEAQYVFDTQNKLTYALAIHAVQVAVQPLTGFVRVVDYYVIHDAGREMNPMIVGGQIVGGVAEGIGGALLAEIVYSDDAQLLTGTLADYLVATAPDIPPIRLDHLQTIPTTNPLGVRGVGECGVIAVAPAIVNAVARAVSPSGNNHQQALFHIPIRPSAVRAAYGVLALTVLGP
jgi:carbon-monoxide dehydrogenase large subunit